MPKPEDYTSIRLEPADDGTFILKYEEKIPPVNPQDHRHFESRMETFTLKEMDKAGKRMQELKGVGAKKQNTAHADEEVEEPKVEA